MSALDAVTYGHLVHKGGEACIYEVQVNSKRCMLKWYNNACTFDKNIINVLLQNRVSGVYHIIESGVMESHAYLLYECVYGICTKNLAPMPVILALHLMRKLAKTLGELQKLGISHGDLNQTNVVLDLNANPILIDFGIVGPGSLSYAAAERFQGKSADVKSDLYSLGMLLFSWITGECLINAEHFDEFACAAANIESVSPTKLLYGMQETDNRKPFSAETLNALDPLWKGVFRLQPEDRIEDFEELDELLEIAINKIGGGAVKESLMVDSLAAMVKTKWALVEDYSKNSFSKLKNRELPFRPRGRMGKKYPNWVLFGVALGIVLFLGCIYLILLKPVTDIDCTGTEIIQNSRNLEKNVPTTLNESLDSSPVENVKNVLQGLPIPIGDSSLGVIVP